MHTSLCAAVGSTYSTFSEIKTLEYGSMGYSDEDLATLSKPLSLTPVIIPAIFIMSYKIDISNGFSFLQGWAR